MKDVNYRFWNEYYPVVKSKFVGVLPDEVKDFHKAETDKMISLVKKGQRYLFIGCGDGREFEPIIDMDIQIVGVDYVKSVIDECNDKFKNRKNVSAIVSSAQNISFEDASFNGVFILYNNLSVLGERIPILKEIKRVLKKGGFLFGTVYNEYAKDVQVESYKGLDMDYLRHDDETVTVISKNGITYTSGRWAEKRLKKLFSSVDWSVNVKPLTSISWEYVAYND
ncbi:MAG: class I SAM-dependent methyltransferase [Candidatus Gracilibacteria bacterium]|jgi:ubiquinone/menaquinone biosynthesis C-methylase UbiE